MCSCANRYAFEYGWDHDPPWPPIVIQSYGQGDKRVFESVCEAAQGQQPAAEHAPLSHQSLVAWMLCVVQDAQSLLQGLSLCH